MNTVKKCSKCLEVKTLIDFEKRPDSKDGYRNYCRSCKYKRHNERLKERHYSDNTLFWKIRATYFNNPSGRRKGIAGIIIKNSKPIDWEDLYNLYNNTPSCNYCHISLKREDIVFDHKTPLCKGGSHTIDNIVVSCHDCNQLKGSKTSKEFTNFIIEYISRFCKYRDNLKN